MAEHARGSQILLVYICLLLLSSSPHLGMSMDLDNDDNDNNSDTDDRFSGEVAPASRRLYGNGFTEQQNSSTSSNRSSASAFCGLLSLKILDLSNNQFTGEIPDCWWEMQQALQFMDLSNNSFSGNIPRDRNMGLDVHGVQHGGRERRGVGLAAINRGGGVDIGVEEEVGIHGSVASAWKEEAAEKEETAAASMEYARGERRKGAARRARRARRGERRGRADRRGTAVARE